MKSKSKPPTPSTPPPRRPPRQSSVRAGRDALAAWWSNPWLSLAALVAITVLVYLPVWKAGFVWDDDSYVTLNATLRTGDGLRDLWLKPRSVPQYYPLVFTVFWIEYQWWVLDPLGYHLVNVALHGLCVVLLWRLLLLLRVPGAWLAAALFAVHPVCVESVAWVTELKNVLSLALALGSMLCYLRFAPPESDEPPLAGGRPRWRWFAAALALFVMALASKTAVTPLPAVLLVIRWWKLGRVTASDVGPLVPFFLLSIAAGLLTRHLEIDHVLAAGPEWDYGPVDRTLIAGRALCFYALKLVWPFPVMMFYPRWDIDAGVAWQYAFPVGVCVALAGLWLARGRIGRGPLAAALIFSGTLSPALGFFNVYFMRFSYVADHFQYHACPALLALLAAGFLAAANLSSSSRKLATVVASLWLALLGAETFRQVGAYEDRESLCRDTLAKNPSSWNACLDLGTILDNRGRHDEALELFQRAVEIKPDEGDAHSSVCHGLLVRVERDGSLAGALQEAIRHGERAVELIPNDAEARRNLGFALYMAQRPQDALVHFDRALATWPEYPEALFGRGISLLAAGDWANAQQSFERALRARPGYVEARHSLAVALANQGRALEAIEQLQIVTRQDPSFIEAQNLLNELRAKRDERR